MGIEGSDILTAIGNNGWLFTVAGLAYLAGSFPSAYFVTRKMSGKNISAEGSGNVGSMNAYGLIKQGGSKKKATAGLLITLLMDLGKGTLAICIARCLNFTGYDPLAATTIASAFVILGHNYPFYFRFKKGGRGIAPLIGILLALKPVSIAIWAGTVLLSIFIWQRIMAGRIPRDSFSSVFSIVGSQVSGRIAGLCLALIPLYLYDSGLLFPVLSATSLILIKHSGVIREMLVKSCKKQAERG